MEGLGWLGTAVTNTFTGPGAFGNIMSLANTGMGLYSMTSGGGGSSQNGGPDPEMYAAAAENQAKKEATERRRLIASRGNPSTYSGGFSGLMTPATTAKKKILGR